MNEVEYVSKKFYNFKLSDLYYQFILRFTDMSIWQNDMSLPNSPQVECAQLLLKYGQNWSKLRDCRFARDRRHRYKLGMKKWTEKNIKEHILGSRYDVLMSIKKYGFDKKKNKKQPVAVLMEPFWMTRFGWNVSWLKGPEIYHGGRRCAAMYALGYERVRVLVMEDKYPGSGKGGKFEKKVLRYL
jgi:hypothetical protein